MVSEARLLPLPSSLSFRSFQLFLSIVDMIPLSVNGYIDIQVLYVKKEEDRKSKITMCELNI